MMPGNWGGELVVIAVVALIVVGPKDLPKLLRQVGRFVGKMRRLADDFRTSFEDMARQSELDELRKEVDALRAGRSVSPVLDDVTSQMRAIEGDINTAAPSPPPYVAPDLSADPQLAGLPPKPAEVQAEPDVFIKKARPRKARPVKVAQENTLAPVDVSQAVKKTVSKPVSKTDGVATKPKPRKAPTSRASKKVQS